MVRRLSAEDLQHQIEQERLINRITTLVYQSRDLPSILKQTVQELRQFMAIDRLLIYQQQHGMAPTGLGSAVPCGIVCESLANPEIPSLVDLIHGGKLTIKPFDPTPSLSFISPDRTPITAELILPILLQTGIWGFLVAHQCGGDRIWQDGERQGLQQIADNLAIAIYQASLYAELQAEKSSLEEKVLERTQHLRDALFLAQTADRAKSDFLALVSHELRSPLTCVIGMASTLLRQTPERAIPEEKQRAYLETIHDRGKRLLATISDILDLSQLESGQTVLNCSNLIMGDLAVQLLHEFAPSAEAKQIQLSLDDHLHYHETTTHGFAADPYRIRQILINLLSNAIKFTPEGGNVVLRLWGNESDIFLQVEDSGIGIPLEYRSVIFEKFQQLDFYRRRSYEGTGLGLALTKQLVELHGGTIDVESSVDQGSTFTVHLPSQTRSAVDYARASRPIRAAEGYAVSQHILLVEQTEELANIVCDFLTPMGYQVTWIADSETAIGHFDAATPALVMVNGTIGETLLLQLKEKAQGMEGPMAKLLILVTEDDRATLEELPQLRPLCFLPLPIGEPEQLIEVVGNLLMNNSDN
jgi:two-component system sensor histidine kinase/response regulator